MTEDDDHDGAIATAIAYHERTKHFPGRYARSLGHLDWATQPDPFRRFEGAPLVALDQIEPSAEHGPSLPRVLAGEVAPPAPLDRRFVSQLFYDSLALSAWKEHGAARWSLRVNPSSGNLHPTEGYWLSGPVDDLLETATVCHYAPHEHALEVRRVLTEAEWSTLASQLPSGAALIALSSIHWREAWKYGERAFRYCHHDVGHAIAAVAIAASTLGWCVRLVEGVADAELARLIGIDSQSGPEAEHADALLALFPDAGGAVHQPFDVPTLVGQWQGKPLPLSPDHVEWPVIDDVARAVRKRE